MRDVDIIDAIIDAIRNGELDLHVEALAEVASRRVELLRSARDAVLMATIRKGDRVQINHSARPLLARRARHGHRVGPRHRRGAP